MWLCEEGKFIVISQFYPAYKGFQLVTHFGSGIHQEKLKVKDSKVNTVQTAEELKSSFAPGKEFGFNVTLELENFLSWNQQFMVVWSVKDISFGLLIGRLLLLILLFLLLIAFARPMILSK